MGQAVTQYRYEAAGSDGRPVRGLLEAESERAATSELAATGLVPIRFKPLPTPRHGRPVPSRELAIMFRNLAELADAGVPLEKALASTQGLVGGRLLECCRSAGLKLAAGRTLAAALEDGSGSIPAAILGLLHAGQRGSMLTASLNHAAVELERQAERQARTRQALAYPVLLLGAGTVAITVLVGIVIPRMAALFLEAGADLPASTRWLLALSSLAGAWWPVGLALLVLLAAGVSAAPRLPKWRRLAHEMLLSLPLIGTIRRELATARFCSMGGAMLRSGLPVHRALAAAELAAGDLAIGRRLAEARRHVTEGARLSAALKAADAASAIAVEMAQVGESSGRLGVMLERAGEFASRQAERRIATLVTLLEPALILVFGALVMLVAAALLQAVYGLRVGSSL